MNIAGSASPRRPPLALLTFLTLPVWPVLALAQDLPSDAPSPETLVQDEDGARFARMRHIEGEVTVEGAAGLRAGELLGVNVPVLAGDRLVTGIGRAEVQFPDGSVLRADQATSVDVMAVADLSNRFESRTVLRLSSGSLYVSVEGIETEEDIFRVDTPTASVFMLTRGVFRIDVAPDGTATTIASLSGVAEVVSEGVSVLVRSGERTDALARRSPQQPRPMNYFREDAFDRWNRERQGAYVKPYGSLPAGDVPDEVAPYVTELAYHGDWIDDPEYGWVWRPAEYAEADWNPYLVGRWHHAPAGWTWVSYEPWGWAPYHYGRWHVSASLGWVWSPGSVYSGGWVSWSYAGGYIGWCPLNYYNYPVVLTAGYHHKVHHYPRRSWVYVEKHHIYDHNIHRVAAPAYHAEELHRSSKPLPRHRGLRHGTRTASRQYVDRGGYDAPGREGDRVSFRTTEGGGRVRRAPSGETEARERRSAPSVRRVEARRASTGPTTGRTAPGTTSTPRRTWSSGTGRKTPTITNRDVDRRPVSGRAARTWRGSTSTRPTDDQAEPAPRASRRPAGATRSTPGAVRRPVPDRRPATEPRQRTTTRVNPRAGERATRATPPSRERASSPRVIRVQDRDRLLERIFKPRSSTATRKPAAQSRRPTSTRPAPTRRSPQAAPRPSSPSRGTRIAPGQRRQTSVTRPRSSGPRKPATRGKSGSRKKD